MGSESRGREEKGKEQNVFFIIDDSAGNFIESDPSTADESILSPTVKTELHESWLFQKLLCQ
jgi:hypothetical protein